MASGSFNIKSGNQYVDGKVDWSSTPNASANTSDLKLTAYLRKSSSSSSSSSISNRSITRNFYVDGTTYGSTENATITLKNNNAYVKVYEKTISGIKHNDDGKKSLTIGFEMIYSGTTAFQVPKTTANITLDTIPRYPSATQSLKDKTEKSITINWYSDSTIDYVWYSKDGGVNFTAVGSVNTTSGSYTISGLSLKTNYNIITRLRRKDSQLTKDSTALPVETYNAPYVKSVPTFVVGEPIKLDLYNPLKRNVVIYMTPNGESEVNIGTTSSETININITDELKEKLYKASPNSALNTYKLKTYCSAIPYTMYSNSGKYTIPNNPPTFEYFEYYDSEENVIDVTGSNQYIIRTKSNLKLKIPASDKMIPKNYANPDRYEISWLGETKSVPYSENDLEIDLGKINISGQINISINAYDKRGFPKNVVKSINVIPYSEVSQDNDLYRINGFENDTKLDIKGTYSLVTIDNVDKNTIEEVKYRYKEKNGKYNDYINVIPTIDGDRYEYETISFNLDNTKEYVFEIVVSDKFGTYSKVINVSVGIPILFINYSKKNVGINCINQHEEGSLQMTGNLYSPGGGGGGTSGTSITIKRWEGVA